LEEGQLYLVFGGRLLQDDKILEDYSLSENDIITVVNGKTYARDVTL
jgi:hypothetical protein